MMKAILKDYFVEKEQCSKIDLCENMQVTLIKNEIQTPESEKQQLRRRSNS